MLNRYRNLLASLAQPGRIYKTEEAARGAGTTQQCVSEDEKLLPAIQMKVAMAGRCRNRSCGRTVIVAEGHEISSLATPPGYGDIDAILDLTHNVTCSHCGLAQVFREIDLKPLAS